MKFIRWLITVAYAGFIFYLSSRQWGGESPFPFADKVVHVALYFVLGGLCLWSLRKTSLKNKKNILFAAIVAASIYGLSDELHQYFVPGRDMSFLDWLADIAGAIAGVFTASYLVRFFRENKNL